jgi:hypothetical protein
MSAMRHRFLVPSILALVALLLVPAGVVYATTGEPGARGLPPGVTIATGDVWYEIDYTPEGFVTPMATVHARVVVRNSGDEAVMIRCSFLLSNSAVKRWGEPITSGLVEARQSLPMAFAFPGPYTGGSGWTVKPSGCESQPG